MYEQYGLYGSYGHLNEILVPTEKLLILDGKKKLIEEEKEYNTLKEKYYAQKTEYINEVRMRKHDMGQYIFELVNIEDLMRYFIENRDKSSHHPSWPFERTPGTDVLDTNIYLNPRQSLCL